MYKYSGQERLVYYMKKVAAELILENGARFTGTAFGCMKDIVGEVVFTTGMTGYQETLSDPSFAGQIVTMTYPLIGNYGTNLEDMESERLALNGLIVREKCDYPNNFRNEMDLDGFLKQHGVMGLEGIDTRALTRIIRNHGVMKGVITTSAGQLSEDEIKSRLHALDNSKVVKSVTAREKYVIDGSGKHIAFIDMGTKHGILRDFKNRGCKITVFPYDTHYQDILDENPDMVFIANGPGDPSDVPETVEVVKSLIGKLPMCGICMGHQIISLALGCRTEKLKFGHHGGNHPVKDILNNKVYITSQNHNYVVCDVPEDVEITYVNVNDGTVEGIRHKTLPIQSVQFHPEATPGPLDTAYIFDDFLK